MWLVELQYSDTSCSCSTEIPLSQKMLLCTSDRADKMSSPFVFIHQDYYSIPFPTPTTPLTGRDGSLSSNPYSGREKDALIPMPSGFVLLLLVFGRWSYICTCSVPPVLLLVWSMLLTAKFWPFFWASGCVKV